MESLEETIRKVYMILESLGYRPVIVGTYALILQGWLPQSYLDETKDVDVYVDEATVIFDHRVEDMLLSIGFSIGRSEAGGFYVDAVKPVEIVYPIYDIYVPRALLEHVVGVKGMRVLEGHAVFVAKALGSSIEHLADIIRLRGVTVNVNRLRSLLESIASEVDPARYRVAVRRIEALLRRYRAASTLEHEGEVLQGEG